MWRDPFTTNPERAFGVVEDCGLHLSGVAFSMEILVSDITQLILRSYLSSK